MFPSRRDFRLMLPLLLSGCFTGWGCSQEPEPPVVAQTNAPPLSKVIDAAPDVPVKPAKIIVKSPDGGKITARPDKGTTVPKSEDDKKTDAPEKTAATEKTPPEKSTTPDPAGCKRLSPEFDVWIDPEKKRVVMKGFTCVREGQLEMLMTLAGGKEHESIVAVKSKAFIIHAALLVLGAESGSPVQFQPEYKPPKGTEIEITFEWTDLNGANHLVRAQDWVRHVRTQQAMTYPFVFAGSGFFVDEATGEKHYLAEEGDLICVSNFPTAMLDVPAVSSQGNDSLLFEAFTERIPPRKTPVTVYLTPKLKQNGNQPEEVRGQKSEVRGQPPEDGKKPDDVKKPDAEAKKVAPDEGQSEFDVYLESFDADKKIGVIKVVRGATGLGLKEAKDLVEAAPKPVKTGLSKQDAAKLKVELEEAGGKVSIK